MNKERILDLADIIENDRLPLVEFNMEVFAQQSGRKHTCGTAACIAGYAICAAYGNRRAKQMCDDCKEPIPKEAQRILGLDNDQASELFHAWHGPRLEYITKSQAVAVLRHLAKTGKVDWSIA